MLVALIAMAAGFPRAGAVLPRSGWIPASQGLVPLAGSNFGIAPPYNYQITHLRADSGVPGRIFAGHLFHGLYASTGGASWASLTPGCLITTPSAERDAALNASGLTACGIIDIATNPLEPGAIYVSTVDTAHTTLEHPVFETGGVFKSTDGGAHWTNVSRKLPQPRGGGLAVSQVPGRKPMIVMGWFQHADWDVGTIRSLGISYDDGASWRSVALPAPKGCPTSVPAVSSRLVATVTFHPTNPNIIYAGTNAGLYQSVNRGVSWQLVLAACSKLAGRGWIGGAWGIGVTPNGSRVYAGTWDGRIRSASGGALRTTSWTNHAVIPATHIRDIVVDVRDTRRLYVSSFGKEKPGAYPGIFRVTGSSVALLADNTLAEVHSRASAASNLYRLVKDAQTPSIVQHPLQTDLFFVATALGGIFTRSD
jgi:hypothetical protein